MSQYPYQDPYQQQPANIPYATPAIVNPPIRPNAVSALAITSIVLGSLWLFSSLVGLASNVLILGNGGRNFVGPQMRMDPIIARIGVVSAMVGFVLGGMMLGGAIGALRLRPVARKVMLLWSVLALIWVVITIVMQVMWISPATERMFRQLQPNNPATGMISAMAIPIAIFSGLLYSIVPVLILILWTRPKVKAAFESHVT